MKKKRPSIYYSIYSRLNISLRDFVLLLSVTALSFFLRFVNYDNRWGLAYDQARDVIVSSQIIVEKSIPLAGPFSASGPFVFGPYWYWINSLLTSLNPNSVMWLWLAQTFIASLIPIVMYIIGRKIINSSFGILLALFMAISTARIAQSTNLTYSTLVGFISVFILLTLVLSIKTNKSIFVFLTALLMGLAVNTHFQAVGFFLLLPILVFLNIRSFSNILLIIIGFSIPFTPLIIFDFLSNHFQSKNVISYLLEGGSSASLPKRWLTYIAVFWPNAYLHTIGGNIFISYLSAGLVISASIIALVGKKMQKAILVSLVFLLFNFVALRYFKGHIYDAFIVYLHPFILLVTAWAIYKLLLWKKVVGFIFLFLVVVFTLSRNYQEITNATNYTAKYSLTVMNDLKEEFPNEKFAFYDYEFKNSSRSYPIVMYMMKNDLLDDSGRKLGFVTATISSELDIHNSPVVMGKLNETILLDLSEFSREELIDRGWRFINPSGVYDSIINWYKN